MALQRVRETRGYEIEGTRMLSKFIYYQISPTKSAARHRQNIHAIGYKFSLHKMLRHRGQSVSNPHCRPQCVEAEMKEKT